MTLQFAYRQKCEIVNLKYSHRLFYARIERIAHSSQGAAIDYGGLKARSNLWHFMENTQFGKTFAPHRMRLSSINFHFPSTRTPSTSNK